MSAVAGNDVRALLEAFDGRSVTLRDMKANGLTISTLADGSVAPGRFENGTLELLGSVVTADVASNSSNQPRTVVLKSDLAIPCKIQVGGQVTPCSVVSMEDPSNLRLMVGGPIATEGPAMLTLNGRPSVYPGEVSEDGQEVLFTTDQPLEIAVTLTDDDNLRDNDAVPAPDTSLLKTKFEPAFVDVQTTPVAGSGFAPFAKNGPTAAASRLLYNFDNESARSEDYWVVYLLGAFQGPTHRDRDPNLESKSSTSVPLASVNGVSRLTPSGQSLLGCWCRNLHTDLCGEDVTKAVCE